MVREKAHSLGCPSQVLKEDHRLWLHVCTVCMLACFIACSVYYGDKDKVVLSKINWLESLNTELTSICKEAV